MAKFVDEAGVGGPPMKRGELAKDNRVCKNARAVVFALFEG